MRWACILFLLASLVLANACVAFSAVDDEIKALESRKTLENQKTGVWGESNVWGKQGMPDSSQDLLNSSLLKGSAPSPNQTSLAADTNKQTKLLLKLIPGDGLIKLTWKPAQYNFKPEDGQLRFTVAYGTESGKLLKTIEVGNADSFIVRELRNYQMYYFQVVAVASKNRLLALKSDEENATPLPAEEQDSKLERSFQKKNSTLLDNQENEPFKRNLRQFGYEFFKNSSQPGIGDSQPASDNYQLGPGDTLNLTIWGSFSANHELMVDRNGEIAIPKVGVVALSGLKFAQARDTIHKAISRYYRNFELNVTLGKIKSIQVFVVGEVETPGSMTISSLSTVINALAAAKGPTHNGSLRTIRLMRQGKLVSEIDLYDMFLSGDRSRDDRIQNGDTIFVPIIGPVVAVAGEVRRPAIYELKGKMSLADVLGMAGGITASGYSGNVQVERFSNNVAKIVLDHRAGQVQAFDRIEILDRDMVKVFPVQEAIREIVSLKGNVLRPGEFQFKKGMRVRDLIAGYGDLLPESYLESAEITRLAQPDFHREILTFNIRKALEGSHEDNIELKEQDSVKVFSRWEMQEKPMVAINGYVVNPGTYDYYPGMTIRDLVSASGSTKRNAFLDSAELTRVNIEGDKAVPIRMTINLANALNNDPQHNIVLQPDDVLIVRGLANWQEATDKFITIVGEVKFPGVYAITRNEKLSSVINRAGGFTDKAYLKGAKFTRKSVKEIQQKRMDEVISRTERDILQKQFSLASVASTKEEAESTKTALDSLTKYIEHLKTLRAEGRIVIRVSNPLELAKSSYDLEMEGGDNIDIPPRPNVVNILGQVYNPTTLVYRPETSDVETYLAKAGGPTREAEVDDMYIIRADGSVYSRQQSSAGIRWSDESRRWFFGSFMSADMDPGDTLVVPQRLEHTAWLRDIKDITTIVSQIALSAGTVFIGLK